MKKISGLMLILVSGILFSICMGQGDNEQEKIKRERTAWVAKCLMDFQSIKVGMTRAEIEKKFKMDGGISRISISRFAHPECEYFKIDVEFDLKSDQKEPSQGMSSKEDKVIKVSKPYIEAPFYD